MIGTHADLELLKRDRPEWQPWLAVIEEIHREAQSTRWDEGVPAATERQDPLTPLVARAILTVDARRARRLFERTASTAGTGCPTHVDALTVLAASVRQDHAALAGLGAECGVDEQAFQSVAALLAVPVLHACRRRWASSGSPHWVEGYCPICGSWPTFTEVCGIERTRSFRCGRCGSGWHARQLVCAYCGTADHDELTTLVPERAGSHAAIDACLRCHGYVKTFTRLQPGAPASVMLDDLASVDLDVAALDLGYRRPDGPGRRFDVTVRDAGGGIFRWRT